MKLRVRKPEEANPVAASMLAERVRINIDIDPALRTALKVRAAQEGRTINAILTGLISEYLSKCSNV